VGALAVVTCAVLFVGLALTAALAEGALVRVDRPIQEWVVGQRRGWLTDVMWWVTTLGTRYVIGALLLALVAWSWITGRCRTTVLVLVAAFALNPLLEWAMKAGVDRVRPDVAPLGPGRGPSFPSGHVLASVGFYGTIPVLVFRTVARRPVRVAAVALASLVILGVGMSRVYIGVHWSTDVLGGFLVGTIVVLATRRALGHHRLDGSRCCRPDLTSPGRIGVPPSDHA
jgi:undecaprenyl-diphosphatase